MSARQPSVVLVRPKDLVEDLLALRRQRRELLRRVPRALARRLHAPHALVVPYPLERLREVLQAEQEPAVGLLRVVRREAREEVARLGVDLRVVSLPARHLLEVAPRGVVARGVRRPVLARRRVRKVDDADLDLGALASARRAVGRRGRACEHVFAV